MKNFILSVLFLALIPFTASAAPTAVAGTVPNLTVGGRTFTDLSNLIVLYAANQGSTYSTFRKRNSAVGYSVTAGKTLTIYAVRLISFFPTAAGSAIFQSDTDVGFNSASAPTNLVYFGGSAVSTVVYPPTAAGVSEMAIDFQVASGKYVGTGVPGSSAGGVIEVFGYEQ